MKRLLVVGALAIASAFTFGTFGAHAAGTCVPNPAGTVCADGDPTTQTGEIYADGNDAGPGPTGYIGVNSTEGVVGCWTGDYNGSTDNVITAIPPTGAPNPSPGPCTPAP